MKPKRRIRILLVDDHQLFRESVERLLAAEPDFEVAGGCATAAETLALLERQEIDVLLLDLDLGRERGGELLQQARRAGFAGRVLMVTAGVSPLEASDLLRSGIAGVFLKHDSPAALCESIREVAAGRVRFDQQLLQSAIGRLGGAAGAASRAFTERERQVVTLVLDGLSNKEIADRLSVSESSVKGLLQQLFAKTGVRTRSQLVRVVLEERRGAIG
ncbi:MAG TPA: response regulator transcription factor [Vicinamibacteria bacterium]|nr:response regulator transcription factor [Vicinamibacteria bacterium]